MNATAVLPPLVILDPLLSRWLAEDIGRGDRATQGLLGAEIGVGQAEWVIKDEGTIAGLPLAQRLFQLLSPVVSFSAIACDGQQCGFGEVVARCHGPLDALLMGERVALNLTMHLSGIATETRRYVDRIADLPTRLVDTRKTTPGLRILEKYATQVGGAIAHRMGLDDAVMLKDNHIAIAGSIEAAIARVRDRVPYPLRIEVEAETLDQVEAALAGGADIVMLDNMSVETMSEAVPLIRSRDKHVKIEASGNITLETIRAVAETGVDYISTSAPIARSRWLDLSMNLTPRTSE